MFSETLLCNEDLMKHLSVYTQTLDVQLLPVWGRGQLTGCHPLLRYWGKSIFCHEFVLSNKFSTCRGSLSKALTDVCNTEQCIFVEQITFCLINKYTKHFVWMCFQVKTIIFDCLTFLMKGFPPSILNLSFKICASCKMRLSRHLEINIAHLKGKQMHSKVLLSHNMWCILFISAYVKSEKHGNLGTGCTTI